MAVKCSAKGCERAAVFLSEEMGLCAEHFVSAARLVHVVEAARAAAAPPPTSPPPAPPAPGEAARPIRLRRLLRTDEEIEEVVSRRLRRSGVVKVRGLVGEFSIEKAGFRTATERVLAIMNRMVGREPDRLELVGVGKDAVLRFRRPPAEPQESRAGP